MNLWGLWASKYTLPEENKKHIADDHPAKLYFKGVNPSQNTYIVLDFILTTNKCIKFRETLKKIAYSAAHCGCNNWQYNIGNADCQVALWHWGDLQM